MELLVVEDDQVLGKAIQRGLTDAGHHCEWVRNGQRGLSEARINACLADDAALQQLGDISRRATSEENVQGTPTFIVNGDKLDASDWASLEARLRTAIGG